MKRNVLLAFGIAIVMLITSKCDAQLNGNFRLYKFNSVQTPSDTSSLARPYGSMWYDFSTDVFRGMKMDGTKFTFGEGISLATASNGLTAVAGDVKLGGTLTDAITTINQVNGAANSSLQWSNTTSAINFLANQTSLSRSVAFGLRGTSGLTSSFTSPSYAGSFVIDETSGMDLRNTTTNTALNISPTGGLQLTVNGSNGSSGQTLVSNGTNLTYQNPVSALTATQIGFGSGTNVLTGEGAFSYDATLNEVILAGTTGNFVTSIFGGEIQLDDIAGADDLTLRDESITATGAADFVISNVSGSVSLNPSNGIVNLGNSGTAGNRSLQAVSSTANADITILPQANGDIILDSNSDITIDAVTNVTINSGSRIIQNGIVTEYVQIGDWNMVTNFDRSVSMPVGVDCDDIRDIQVIIINDANDYRCSLFSAQSLGDLVEGSWGCVNLGPGTLSLSRRTGGFFDSTDYDATSYNRGFIKITYEN